MKITPERRTAFDGQGNLHLPDRFSGEEIAVLRAEAEEDCKSGREEVRREPSRAPRIAVTALLALMVSAGALSAREPEHPAYKRVEKLYSGDKTVIDETIRYPEGGPAEIQSLIVTLQPGETTGWHKHGVPTYGYILEGKLTVDYGDKGKRVYPAGTAFMEAVDWWHDGTNSGSVPVRVLVVFMGAKGHPAVIEDGAPEQGRK